MKREEKRRERKGILSESRPDTQCHVTDVVATLLWNNILSFSEVLPATTIKTGGCGAGGKNYLSKHFDFEEILHSSWGECQ